MILKNEFKMFHVKHFAGMRNNQSSCKENVSRETFFFGNHYL